MCSPESSGIFWMGLFLLNKGLEPRSFMEPKKESIQLILLIRK
jgi:hypothetical protein